MFYGWKLAIAAMVVLAINGPATVSVANMFQGAVTQEFGITDSLFSIINVISLGVGIFVSPYIADKLSTDSFKKFLMISSVIYAVSFGLLGASPNIYVSLFLSVFVGFGYCATTILPTVAMMNHWFISKRGLALSIALSGLGLGGVIFSYLIAYLLNHFGWRATYVIYGFIILFISLPVMMRFYIRTPEEVGEKPLKIKKKRKNIQSEEEEEERKVIELPFSQTLKTKYCLLLIVGAVFVGLACNSGFGQFPPYLYQLYDINPALKAATVMAIYSGVGVAGKILLGMISDRFSSVVAVIIASLLMVLAYITIIFAKEEAFAIISAVSFGLGVGIASVMPALFISDIYGKKGYAKAYGYTLSALQLGMTLGSFVTATIADLLSYDVAWVLSAVICALMGICWVGAYKDSQKHAQ